MNAVTQLVPAAAASKFAEQRVARYDWLALSNELELFRLRRPEAPRHAR